MLFHFDDTAVGELPTTFLQAQLNYLRHFRQLMRVNDKDENNQPAPHLWHWAIMLQPKDLSLVPVIQSGPRETLPRWLKGRTLAVIAEETGEVLVWAD